ncbi:MAG: transporter substrate-binding domain-containing protein [Anaerolineae bacterium]|nr:transporter substrate-binding domain-containing protein [Anaerolineae bacterium]
MPSPIGAQESLLRYAVFPAPPYMIGANDPQAGMSGIDVEIVQEIARRLQLNLVYVSCTWERCLELMKNGKVDLLSSAYKKADREEYMAFLDQPYLDRLPIAFYYLKDNNYQIKSYEDLYRFKRVGVLQGASYFDRFDTDEHINKVEVSSQDQLFPMLLAGRLDIIAGYTPTENYHIYTEGYSDKIKRSFFVYHDDSSIFMAISKKSLFMTGRLDDFNRINNDLLKEGFIKGIINAYYARYH